jgi:hypothetical protein
VDQDGIVHTAAEHAHHRSDAAARGEEQDLARLLGEDELALRYVEAHDRAGPHPVHKVVGDMTGGLHRDLNSAGSAGDRIAAPVPDAVDVDADPEPLAGAVPWPAGSRLDHKGGRLGGLPPDLGDPAAELGGRPERVDQSEIVLGEERGGERTDQTRQGNHWILRLIYAYVTVT